MSKATNFDYRLNNYHYIMDEVYRNVGASFNLGSPLIRAFSEVDFAIQDEDSNGTFLELDVDYEFADKDQYYSDQEGTNIWKTINILNPAYEVGDLYVSYRCYGSYFSKDAIESLQNDIDTNTSDIATLQSNPTLPAGYITGLNISNGTDTEHDIDIAVGRCKDSTGAMDLVLASEITKQIDAAWAVGDDAGGLDTGSVAADTFYYIFLIRKDSDGSIDALFSLSKTGPTMPAGYTYFRRIRGAVLTDGSANIIQFKQKDEYFDFDQMQIDYSTVNSTNAKTDITVSVPPDMIGDFAFIVVAAGNYYGWLRRTDCTDVAPSLAYQDIRTAGDQQAINKNVMVDASSQISYRMDTTGIDVYIYTNGFLDNAEI